MCDCECKEDIAFELYKYLTRLDGVNIKVPDDDTITKHLALYQKCLKTVCQSDS